jgi:hypothetical protein
MRKTTTHPAPHARRIRRPGAAALVVTTVVVGAAVGAWGAIPGSDGRVRGCYATTNGLLLGIPFSKGDLRVVDEGETCRSYERAVSWSQVGPQGPVGPAAVVLPIHVENSCSATGSFVFCVVDCPAGTRASGGGATSDGNGIDSHLIRNDPRVKSGVATGWLMSVGAPTSRNLAVTVHALCI